MDKKNTLLGVLFLIAAFASMYFSAGRPPVSPVPQSAPAPGSPAGGATPPATPAGNQAPAIAPAPAAAPIGAFADIIPDNAAATISTLQNDYVEVRLTNFGGAIRDIALKKKDKTIEQPGVPYVINELHENPALAFVDFPGLDRGTPYTLVPSASPQEIVFRTVILNNTVEVTRRYTLPARPREIPTKFATRPPSAA